MQRIRKNGSCRGFTLIEMMIVVCLIVILVSIAVPVYNHSILHAKEATLRQDLFTLRSVISQYTLDKQKAPQSLEDLIPAGYIKSLPKDPFTNETNWTTDQEDAIMKDGTDAVADWPILNALLNTAAGASWVSVHNGGGVGIGYSLHAGQVTVADGTEMMAKRIERVLTTDPGMGIIRHADAGYEEAKAFAQRKGVKVPMEESS